MAQHIGIEKIDEKGIALDRCKINFAIIVNTLYKIDSFQGQYPWLSGIDPYGDTIINRIQSQLMIIELLKLRDNMDDMILTQATDEVVSFIKQIDIHQYIKFIGD